MSIHTGHTFFNQKDLNNRVDLLGLANKFLNYSQHLFCLRTAGHNLIDCWYHDDGPEIFYPRPEQIAIRLSSDSQGVTDQIIYQLAHEVIHCISPSGGVHANVLEEGIAVFYSVITVKKYGLVWEPSMASYKQARSILEPYLINHPLFIKMVRQQEQYIFKVSKDHLLNLDIDICEQDAILLSDKFVRF